MEGLRARHLAGAAGLAFDDLLSDYFFVRMGDLISLFFANQWAGPRPEGDYVVRVTDSSVAVSPDPFDRSTVPFSIGGRLVPAHPYATAADAAAAFSIAPVVTLDAVAIGS